jgi:DNA-binding transcriptional ArsR family regulator
MSARFSIIPVRAIDDMRLSRGALLVLAALGAYADTKNGWCWPSQGEIAKRIRIHRTNVGRHIAELEQLGYIEKRRQTQEGKGEITSLYRVLYDGELPAEFDAELQAADAKDRTPPVHSDRTPPVHSDRTPPVHSDRTRTSQLTTQGTPHRNAPCERAQAPNTHTAPPSAPIAEPATTATATTPKASVPDEFEAFWHEYPQRAGGNPKNQALKSWNARHKEGHSTDEILAGTRRYAAFCTATNKTGTEYVKQASTFINQKDFLESWDLPTTPTPTKPLNGQRYAPPPQAITPEGAKFDAILRNLNTSNLRPVIEGECYASH